jgi:hypothetical protein
MSDYGNTSDWGRSKASTRYGNSGTLQPKTAAERMLGSPATTKMPDKGPSDSYNPPSSDDKAALGDMAKKRGGRS